MTRDIIREIVEMNPHEEVNGWEMCFFCGGEWETHKPGCLWVWCKQQMEGRPRLEDLAKEAANGVDPSDAYDALVFRLLNKHGLVITKSAEEWIDDERTGDEPV